MKTKVSTLLFSLCVLFASAQLSCEPVFQMKFSNDISVDGVSSFQSTIIGNGGTFETDRQGNPGCAYRFYDSETDFLQVNDDGVLNFDPSTEFSISLWYRGGSADYADEEVLLHHGSQYWYWSPTQMDYFMMLYDLNQPSFMGVWYSVYQNIDEWMNDTLTWHHLVGVYNNQSVSFYFDNAYEDTQQLDQYEYNSYGSFLQIGKGFQGVLDDIQIFDCALNAADVSTLYYQDALCENCSGDFDGNAVVNTSDLLMFVAAIGCNIDCGLYDLTGDGIVGASDVIQFISLIGTGCN